MQKEDEKRSFLKRYWWVFIGALGAVALATALNLSSADGWILITDFGNDSYDLGWNTTRPTVCSAGNYSYWTGTTFLCSPDTTGGGSNSSDGNNYTTSQSFEYSGNNIILQTARSGASNVSAFFTMRSSTGLLLNNGVVYANATNCSSGQYSRYENNGWNCYNDASGGSGTVTSVNVTTTSDNGSVLGTGGPVTVSGSINLLFYNASPFQTGLLRNVDFTTFNGKADVGDCVGSNSTHVNVTMNVSYGGPQCVAVALNPGGSSFDPSGLYANITYLNITLHDVVIRNATVNGYLPYSAPLFEQEFTHVTSTSAYGFLGSSAVGSGTVTILNGEVNHPGIVSVSDSTTAGGGYYFRTAANAFLLAGGERFVALFRAPGGKVGQTNHILGFFDTGNTIGNIAEGCFFVYNLSQAGTRSIEGRCRNVSVETRTTTSYTPTNNTWYAFYVEMNANGKVANFTLTNGMGTILWSDNVSTNTPVGDAFRQTGAGYIGFQNTTDAASVIGHLDYISVWINRSLSRY